MQIDVHNTKNEKVGTAELPDDVFAAEIKEELLWQAVKAQRASRRAGTHKTKNRAEVSGTGAKPYRQKGTGRARQGSLRAPHYVGGGVAHGPRPRDYSYRMPRAARRAALKTALSLRVRDEAFTVLDEFQLEAPKTREVASFLDTLGTRSVLIVDVANANLKRSVHNLPKSKWLAAEAINVYDILNHDKLVVTQAALAELIRKATGVGAGEDAA